MAEKGTHFEANVVRSAATIIERGRSRSFPASVPDEPLRRPASLHLGGGVLMADRDVSFRAYLRTTRWADYLRANLRLIPLNLALTAGVLLYHFQPALGGAR